MNDLPEITGSLNEIQGAYDDLHPEQKAYIDAFISDILEKTREAKEFINL